MQGQGQGQGACRREKTHKYFEEISRVLRRRLFVLGRRGVRKHVAEKLTSHRTESNRIRAQTYLLADEEFCMQTDSHMDFVESWDTLMMAEWKATQNE